MHDKMANSELENSAVYQHQVAGLHSGNSSLFRCGSYGVVLKPYKLSFPKLNDNKYLKLPDEDNQHERAFATEFDFYEALQGSEELSALRQLTAAYHGVTIVRLAGKAIPHLSLADQAVGCRCPCAADIKMAGKDSRCKPQERRLQQQKKYPSLREVGWCIAGLQQYSADGQLISKLGPSVSGSFSADHVRDVLQSFLLSPNGCPLDGAVTRLVTQFRHQVALVLRWFRSQQLYWFRNSSILLVYNAEYFQKNWDTSWADKMKIFNPESSVSNKSSDQNDGGKTNDISTDVKAPDKSVDTMIKIKTCTNTSKISLPKGKEETPQSNESSSSIYTNFPNNKISNGVAANQNVDEPELIVRVKMIDFAHVLEADGEVDHRYISGLSDIIALCDDILHTAV